MDNNIIRQAMAKAVIEVPEQVKKVDRKEQTLQYKFDAAYLDIKFIRRYIDKYSSAPDEIDNMLQIN